MTLLQWKCYLYFYRYCHKAAGMQLTLLKGNFTLFEEGLTKSGLLEDSIQYRDRKTSK